MPQSQVFLGWAHAAAPGFVSAWAKGCNEIISEAGMLKNVASQKIGAQMVSATDGSAFTGSVTVSVTVDAGTQATGSVGSGACTHEGNGYHTYAPAQAETNGDLVAFTFTGTGAVPVTVQVYTLPATGILAPTTAGRTLDVSAGGEAGIDWANIGSPTTTVGLSGTTVKTATDVATDTADIKSRLPAALTGDGNIKADALRIGGTTQTGRDLGTSVLLSSGTGTGQISLSSGAVLLQATQTGVTIPTVTNLTNAPTSGDLTATMKTSVGTAVAASAVASVTGNVGGNVAGSVGSVTGNVGGNVGGNVTGSVGSLAAQAKADVNAEVLDVLDTDTFAQPGQESPAATTTLRKMLAYLYKAWRNKHTQTASEYALYADDGSTKDQEAGISDDGTTFTRNEVQTGA